MNYKEKKLQNFNDLISLHDEFDMYDFTFFKNKVSGIISSSSSIDECNNELNKYKETIETAHITFTSEKIGDNTFDASNGKYSFELWKNREDMKKNSTRIAIHLLSSIIT